MTSQVSCISAAVIVAGSICTGLFKMIVGVLTTCHAQYT